MPQTEAFRNHKDYYMAKYKKTDVSYLVNRKLTIHKQLERPSRTYVVYSDLHGSYEKYLYWLKNGLGYYRIIVSEILGSSYSEDIYKEYEKLFLIVNRTRLDGIRKNINENIDSYNSEDFFTERVSIKFIDILKKIESKGISKKRIIKDVLHILRLITREDEHRIIKVVPKMFLENIMNLYFKKDRDSYNSLISGIAENEKVFALTLSTIVKLTLLNMFDKHINLGDTFDRGNDADKLVSLYKAYFGPATSASPLHYIWGNHDILWLGASIGNPILAATALRISLRYNNVNFLFRYGFNLDKLKEYAIHCYKDVPTGKYIKTKSSSRWSTDILTKMTKVLQIIEEKLTVIMLREASEIPGEIDYMPEYKRHLALLQKLPKNVPENTETWNKMIQENPLFTDVYFPTISEQRPEQLTAEEQEIIDDITNQFMTLPKLQDDIKWLSKKGETYRVVDNTLYYHAAIPATEDKKLAEIKGMSGKTLLDFIQTDLKRIGRQHRDGEEIKLREKMLLWYLWCGEHSPFFCKSKMATLERAVFNKEEAENDPLTTWKEKANPYYSHMRDDHFLNKVRMEFHAEKICMGHMPMKTAEQGILSINIGAYIVDGGASEAYGDRGVVLINTPDYTYLTQHPPLKELIKAEEEDRLPDINITPLEERKNFKLRHMDKGYFLRKELDAINTLLDTRVDSFFNEYFFE